jgi:hypothetical protein
MDYQPKASLNCFLDRLPLYALSPLLNQHSLLAPIMEVYLYQIYLLNEL